jgi:hypothetical protein
VVQDGPDRKGSNIRRDCGNSEHEVQADLNARVDVIWACTGVTGTAHVLIGPLLFEDGLEGSISKDYTCCEEAVDDGRKHLYCA